MSRDGAPDGFIPLIALTEKAARALKNDLIATDKARQPVNGDCSD